MTETHEKGDPCPICLFPLHGYEVEDAYDDSVGNVWCNLCGWNLSA